MMMMMVMIMMMMVMVMMIGDVGDAVRKECPKS
jgi:hypothetical protein